MSRLFTGEKSRTRSRSLTKGPLLLPEGILAADELARRNNQTVQIAGRVIARQRPGTVKGFVFLSLEDETSIANVIITPDVFEQNRFVVTRSRFLLVEGPLQKQDGVIHVKAARMVPLIDLSLEVRSRDLH